MEDEFPMEVGDRSDLSGTIDREVEVANVMLRSASFIVFANELQQLQEEQSSGDGALLNLLRDIPSSRSLSYLLSFSLEEKILKKYSPFLISAWLPVGRIGPSKVRFDVNSSIGSFMINNDRLGLNSQDNFSTIKGNCCVFKGKWQYELMLGTKGVMQLGWATMGCQFSQEKGVGDTHDSYAYDGNRQRRWNVTTHKYGDMWQCGDIISCTVDLDLGHAQFYRNGHSLGVAFTTLRLGPDVAYFPAVSLALGENLIANFGAAPFRYPQTGFSPLEAPPIMDVLKAQRCFGWLMETTHLTFDWEQHSELKLSELRHGDRRRTVALLLAQHIGCHLGPLLIAPYMVESAIVPALKLMAGLDGSISVSGANKRRFDALIDLPRAHMFLDLLIGSLEEHELLKCLENLVVCLLTGHKQASETIEFRGQRLNLCLLYVLLTHTRLRKYCLRHILFDKVRFPSFMNIKTIDEEGLAAVVPFVWWGLTDGTLQHGDKQAYDDACGTIKRAVEEVEEIQLAILHLILKVDDAPVYQQTSRALFMAKFRSFLKEHMPGYRTTVAVFTPLPVILCLFHRLLALFNQLWATEIGSGDPSVPPWFFYAGTADFYDTQRLGGLESHLSKVLQKERKEALDVHSKSAKVNATSDTFGASASFQDRLYNKGPSTSGAILGDSLLEKDPVEEVHYMSMLPRLTDGEKAEPQKSEFRDSLLHLLDGIVLLYHIGAHKQLGKVAAQSDAMVDHMVSVSDIDKKLNMSGRNSALMSELQLSRQVFVSKLNEEARQQAWTVSVIHSYEKHQRFLGLMRVILTTLKEASKEGELFGFVPDFYVETLTEMCTALRLYFPSSSLEIEGYHSLLIEFGEFLALHFCDSRIVYADSKDSLIQALAGFVCHPMTLKAMESMSHDVKYQMVVNLVQPYENRAWAQNNWILMRFWKGCGFGFRYNKSPHMTNKFGPKPAHTENPNFPQTTTPSPSLVIQDMVKEVLEELPEVATSFLNSLLNQLNWAFSEFIGMLQEIQNASNRPERVFIDSRQLRICATCFDLTLGLLRVLEMVASVSPGIFLEPSRPNSEMLLSRLCQLLCQVLNRVSGWSGCFSHVVGLEIPGLETIHHYPIVTAVIGILLVILRRDLEQVDSQQHVATQTLLSEPSFQLSSMCRLLGEPQGGEEGEEPEEERGNVSIRRQSSSVKFSFRNYPDDILLIEITLVERLIHHLTTSWGSRALGSPQSGAGDDDDSLCTICYAYVAHTTFEPCGHTSCRACITQHLMNRPDCFFCKTAIERVIDQANEGVAIFEASHSNAKVGPGRTT